VSVTGFWKRTHEFGGAPDDPERISDLVGNSGDHLAQRRQTLGLVQLVLELPLSAALSSIIRSAF